jgi:hypothetical protein
MEIRRPAEPTATRARRSPTALTGLTSGVVRWRPRVALAPSLGHLERPRPVALAEPSQRPESVKARIDTTCSVLARLEEARQLLTAHAAHLDARAVETFSEWDRVSVAIDTYRVDAALDAVLAATSNQVSALLKERGLLR